MPLHQLPALDMAESPFDGYSILTDKQILILLNILHTVFIFLNERERVEPHLSWTPAQYRYPPVPARLSGRRRGHSSHLQKIN